MKRILAAAVFFAFSTPAMPADLAPAAAEPMTPVALPYSWTGFYLGANAGYAWGQGDGSYSDGVIFETAHPKADGALVGGQAGYNYQWGSWVLGAEAELDYSSATGTSPIDAFVPAHNDNALDYLGSATLRAGYAFDRFLVYAKGGVGFTQLKMKDFDGGGYNAKGSGNLAGWTLGAGLEYALTDHWSVKGEYQYYRFDAKVALNDPSPFRTYDDIFTVHAIKAGVNYKF